MEEEVLPQDMAGPPVWHLIHQIALKDSSLEVGEAQLLMEGIVAFFPCPHCRAHGESYLLNNPVALPFYDWTVEYHNAVNKRARKAEWTLAKAKRSHGKIQPGLLGKALKILLYNLEKQPSEAQIQIKEVVEKRSRQHQQLQLLVGLLEKAWPLPDERPFFQSLSITPANASVYLYNVLGTVPSIKSEFPKRLTTIKQEFVAEAKQLLQANTSSIATPLSRTRRTSSSSRSQTVMVWIIVFLSLFLVLYFVFMMQK